MGAQSRREYRHRTVEHTVPRGADMADLGKAEYAAMLEYRRLHRLPLDPDAPFGGLPDDWAEITADDEHVIIRLTVREAT